MEQTVDGDVGYRLKLSGGVPKYPIVNKAFDVELSIVDEIDQIRYHNVEVPIVYRAVWEGTLELCPPGLVEVSPSSLFIKTNGTAVASISIKEVSALHDNNKILIIFEERKLVGGNAGDTVASTSTPALCCVRHKLTVEDWDEKDRLMTSPYVWYKDEGGKDKCIELKICLTDDCDKKVHNRVVPLKATLMYECGQEVQQQNILVINLHDSKVSIDETGEGVIKLRINEVSNRHRSQRFQIMVSAEHQPDCSDISPAFSIPVDVKSKRNNRPRDGDPLSTSFSTSDLSEPAAKRKSLSTKTFDNQYANNMASVAATSLGVGPGMSVNMNAENHNMMLNHGQHQTVAQVKRVKQTKAQTQALSQSVVTNMSANVSNFSGNQNPLSGNSSNQYSGHSTTSGSANGGGGGSVAGSAGGENLSCAVDHVIRWATTVMTAVEKIQWRPLGFAQNLDGSHDFSRCLSSIPDPTLHIVEIVKQYESTVMPSLHFLLAAAKEGDKDALLGLQGPGGGYQSQFQSNRQRSSGDDSVLEESLLSRSSSSSSNSNNNSNNNSHVNSSMCINSGSSINGSGGSGHQSILESKNGASEWLLSGGETFRSSSSVATTDADLFSYQMPIKLSPSRQSSTATEGTYNMDDGRQGTRNDKGIPSLLSGGSNSGNGLSLAPPSMQRETSLSSFAFGGQLNTPTVSEPSGELEMPQLSRNHSLYGFLEVPSLSRCQSLSRTYEDAFGNSPRSGNVFGSSSRGVGQGVPSAGSAAPFMSMFSGTNDLYEFNASSGKSLSGGLKDGEHLVHYILAKPLHTDVGSMGIPAFDQGKSLIGLYREGQGQDKSTILDYLPLSALMSVLTEKDCMRAKDSLEEAIASKNRSVHVLGSSSSSWKNSLEMMKEDAMIFSLAREAEEEEKLHNYRKSLSRAPGNGTYDRMLNEKESKLSSHGSGIDDL